MPHHINTRKKRQYEKRLLQGGGSITQGYIAIVAIDNRKGSGYAKGYGRTDFIPFGGTDNKTGTSDRRKIDVFKGIKYVTKIIERSDHKSAVRAASRYGAVQSCRKIQEEFYIKRIEHLILPKPQPVMEIADFSVKVDKNLVAEKRTAKKTFTIEIENNT